MTRPSLAWLLAGAACIPFQAGAQAPAPVETVTVESARLPTPLSLTPGAHVLTAEDIQRRGAPFVADVLAEVPGVSISENGAFGGVSTVRLRGASGDKTLTLIDGVPVNDPSAPAGGFDFSSLDVANVGRVEVLSGPQSALWGSDAIGGVVSISTREAEGVSLSAEGGSLATVRTAASLGHATEGYAFGAGVSTFRTDGVSKADFADGAKERDGFNTTTVSANARVTPNARISFDARARVNLAATEYDQGFGGRTGVTDSNDSSDVRTASGYVRAQVKDLLGFDHTLRADLMDLDRQYHGAFPFGALGGQQLIRWSAQRQQTLYGVSLGAEHRSAQENTGGGRQTSDATGYYAIGRWTPEASLNLTASLRQDEAQHYGGQTTGRLAAAWGAGAGFTIKGSWGQGFKVPSIYETTYPCFECAHPGPAKTLRAEHADGWDAGLAWAGGPVSLDLTWFDLRVRDQIDYRFGAGYLNTARVRSTGLEASAEVRLPSGFSARGQLTHDDAVDGLTGLRLPKVPRDTGSASVGWQGGKITVDVGLRAQDAAADVYGTIQPFAVAYMTGAYALTPSLSLTARVENLGDVHYQQAFGYGEPGRMVLIGLRWRP